MSFPFFGLKRFAPFIPALTLIFAASLPAQILQQKPGLCGTQSAVPLPPGVSAATDQSNGRSTLTIRSRGAAQSIPLPGVQDEIQQVCPLGGDRMVVFGGDGGNSVYVVDAKSGTVTDAFESYSPAMSPDQRWIAMRQFYPAHTDFTASEEYLLYDLKADAHANQRGVTPYTVDAHGAAIYPVTSTGAPGNRMDVPASRAHRFRSASFYWSSDSQFVAFADSVAGTLSVVLASPKSTLVHSVATGDVCPGSAETTELTMANAQVIPTGGGATVIAEFKSDDKGCMPKQLTLTMSDFKVAAVEEYAPLGRKAAVPSH